MSLLILYSFNHYIHIQTKCLFSTFYRSCSEITSFQHKSLPPSCGAMLGACAVRIQSGSRETAHVWVHHLVCLPCCYKAVVFVLQFLPILILILYFIYITIFCLLSHYLLLYPYSNTFYTNLPEDFRLQVKELSLLVSISSHNLIVSSITTHMYHLSSLGSTVFRLK
jgi:hypothetical protein